MLTNQQIKETFTRIGLSADLDLTPSPELLAQIQYGFCTTVPYENIDILRGIPLSLEESDLYDKIVTRHRGGYCFEINGFLGMLLRSLGYNVTEYTARYLRGETTVPMRRHRVLEVLANDGSRWLCDAGIGQAAFRYPLPLVLGAVSEQCGETYKIEEQLDPFYGYVVADLHHGAWRRFYAFTLEKQLNIDYIMPSFWCEKHPDSPFTHTYILSVKTETGRKTLDGTVFRIFDGETVTERELTDGEIPAILSDVFGIIL